MGCTTTTPFDPYLDAFRQDPIVGVLTILLIFALSYGGEFLLAQFWVAPRVAKKAREDYRRSVQEGEWDGVIARATKDVQERVESIQGQLAEFDDSMATILGRLEEEIQAVPERLKMAELGRKGAVVREMNKGAEEAAEELEAEVYELMTPEERIAQRIEEIKIDDSKGSELGRAIARMGKEVLAGELRKRAGVHSTVARMGGGGKKAKGFK